MPHVQLAGDVRRREAHGELLLVARRVSDEKAVRLPARVPAGLNGLWIERFRHLAVFLQRGVLHGLRRLSDAGVMVAVSATGPARVRLRVRRGSWLKRS